MTAVPADAEQAPAPVAPTPGRKFRVEALALGASGAVKLLIMTTREPDLNRREEYKARVSAQYRQEFDEWADPAPKVTVYDQATGAVLPGVPE